MNQDIPPYSGKYMYLKGFKPEQILKATKNKIQDNREDKKKEDKTFIENIFIDFLENCAKNTIDALINGLMK